MGAVFWALLLTVTKRKAREWTAGPRRPGPGFRPCREDGKRNIHIYSHCSIYTRLGWLHPFLLRSPLEGATLRSYPISLVFLSFFLFFFFFFFSFKDFTHNAESLEPRWLLRSEHPCTGEPDLPLSGGGCDKTIELFSEACEIGPCSDSAGLSVHK